MWVLDYTLNTMTILALTLAVGVVIDDAIVVLENIERHRETGESAAEAASSGAREVAFAATAATIGFVHTVTGPDHYLPFVVIGRARNWRLKRTLGVTVLCGIGHVLGSVALGLRPP